jgi:hypothetical protein
MPEDDATPKERRPRSGCSRGGRCCLALLVSVCVLGSWELVARRRRHDEQFATAIRRVLAREPLTFDKEDVALVLEGGSPAQNFEVARADLARVVSALAPLGEVRSVTLLSLGPRKKHWPLAVRCRVEGTRDVRDVTFTFEPRDLPFTATRWGLRAAALEAERARLDAEPLEGVRPR